MVLFARSGTTMMLAYKQCLASFAKDHMHWTLISPCSKKINWKVHDWCLSHYVPIQYIGAPTERIGRSLTNRTLTAATSTLVFEQRNNKRQDFAIQTARTMKLKVMLELFDPPPRKA